MAQRAEEGNASLDTGMWLQWTSEWKIKSLYRQSSGAGGRWYEDDDEGYIIWLQRTCWNLELDDGMSYGIETPVRYGTSVVGTYF